MNKNSCLNVNELLPLGKISKPHGLNGEVRVFLYSGNVDSITRVDRLFISKKEDEKPVELKISNLRIQNKITIIKLEGVNTIEEASELRGLTVMVDKCDLPEPKEDEYYWFQLIGLNVVTIEGNFIGTVKDLVDREPQALLVVENDKKEFLIPMVDTIIQGVKLEGSEVIITPIEGLLD
ncbi:MAG: ribosome maturation factor RimM [Thermodesulfobacteriota bacterium]